MLYTSLSTYSYKRNTCRDTSKDISRDAGRDSGRDSGRDTGRDTGKVRREIGGWRVGKVVEKG
jgi:hypothetical protein